MHCVNCVSPSDRTLSGLDSLAWKTPRKCFPNKHRKEKVKRFREKVGGWRPGQKTGETENAINCEGQRVKGQRCKRGHSRRKEKTDKTARKRNQIRGDELVCVWHLMNSEEKKKKKEQRHEAGKA